MAITSEELCEKIAQVKCCLAEKTTKLAEKLALGLCNADEYENQMLLLHNYSRVLEMVCPGEDDDCLTDSQIQDIFEDIELLCENCNCW